MLGMRMPECIMRESDAVPIIGSGKCSSNSCILDLCLWHWAPLPSLMGCPYIMNYSWGSSKSNAIFSQRVPDVLFLYVKQSQILGVDNYNQGLFLSTSMSGDTWKWHEMPDNSSLDGTILVSLSPPKFQHSPLNIAVSKNVMSNPSVGRELRRKKAYEHGSWQDF